ncbi:hypothetical protein DERF_000650 [Dermatophagoides farinae]|uniref:Uncharacterized protein n=1 Tax=Dermatophagoides farinae TaxID=6954 RepID=A0A922IAL9_DERFA|nr:hypothetical protein DERF_000650 [Dermatophagoides farinae]
MDVFECIIYQKNSKHIESFFYTLQQQRRYIDSKFSIHKSIHYHYILCFGLAVLLKLFFFNLKTSAILRFKKKLHPMKI